MLSLIICSIFFPRYGWFSAQGRIPGEEMGMAEADNTPLSNNPVQAVVYSLPSIQLKNFSYSPHSYEFSC